MVAPSPRRWLGDSGTESTMTDSPPRPDDLDPTIRYDPPQRDGPAPATEAPAVTPASPTSPAPPTVATAPPPPSAVASPPTVRARRDDPGRIGSIVFGIILVAVGLWFFADQTLGFDMPQLRWSELWPVLIIGIGAWILLASMRRAR
jgi:hypothetical protein